MSFYRAAADFNFSGMGVLVLGAGDAREFSILDGANPSYCVWVEAIKGRCENIQKRVGERLNHHVVNLAITNHDGAIADFHVYSPQDFSSLLHKGIDFDLYNPNVREMESVYVRTTTIDSLLERMELNPASINVLWLQLQGSELFALDGAKKLLETGRLQYVLTDLIEADYYKGGAKASDVHDFLSQHNFSLHREYNANSTSPISFGVYQNNLEEAATSKETSWESFA